VLKNILWIVAGVWSIGFLINEYFPEFSSKIRETSSATSSPTTTTASKSGDSAAPQQQQSKIIVSRPENQTKFLEAVAAAQNRGRSAENDMQKGGIFAARNTELCRILEPSTSVENWTGKISKIDSNSDGKGVFGIEMIKDVEVKTWNNALSDIGSDTLLEPGTDLFNKLASMKVGAEVVFSGSFFPQDDTCIKESSLTLDGKLRKPEFIFKFTAVETL
jgi:hypothetical protein